MTGQRFRRLLTISLLCGVGILTSGCGPLLFRQDHRLAIQSPHDRSTVRAPLNIHWSARDFASPADGHFAVFLDRDPQPPGESLEYFPKADRSQGIFVVAATSLRIDTFQRDFSLPKSDQNLHDVTVILLDRNGRRIGESAAFAQFRVQ
ncbi:MAG: hypothetical protein ACR2MY_04465 [Candidatus Dormibacteria bacterium]